MKIGLVREIKNNENRVAMDPAAIYSLVEAGHDVLVESEAGLASGFPDESYEEHGGKIIDSAQEVWESSELIMKVKEPQPEEYKYFREGLMIFTYFHLANEPQLTDALLESGATAIAYETVVDQNGKLPLLTPMSEVAGIMAVQTGAHYLEKPQGGKGKLLMGVPGVERGTVTIIGGGVVGAMAARMAIGMRANVNILDLNPDRSRELVELFGNDVQTLASNPANIEKTVAESDIVIGSVLIPGSKAPKLVTEEMIKSMEPGSVVVDIAIDQGGNFETLNEPTTHDDPIRIIHDVVHYGVANIPGAVPQTSTQALVVSTLPYILKLANDGLVEAVKADDGFQMGVNTYKGHLTNVSVAKSLDMEYTNLLDLI